MNRKQFDDWFPTVVRYFGIVLVFVLAISTVLSNGHVEYPSLIVAATGMILYKTIRGATNGDNGNGVGDNNSGSSKSKHKDSATAIKDEDDRAERWSHLE